MPGYIFNLFWRNQPGLFLPDIAFNVKGLEFSIFTNELLFLVCSIVNDPLLYWFIAGPSHHLRSDFLEYIWELESISSLPFFTVFEPLCYVIDIAVVYQGMPLPTRSLVKYQVIKTAIIAHKDVSLYKFNHFTYPFFHVECKRRLTRSCNLSYILS